MVHHYNKEGNTMNGTLLSNEISHRILDTALVAGKPAGEPKDYNLKTVVIALSATPANVKVFAWLDGVWYDVTLIAGMAV